MLAHLTRADGAFSALAHITTRTALCDTLHGNWPDGYRLPRTVAATGSWVQGAYRIDLIEDPKP